MPMEIRSCVVVSAFQDMSPPQEVVDGRNRRRLNSFELAVDALLDLIESGNSSPTAQDIAERSGISVRTVFRLTENIESLHAAVVTRQIERTAHLYVSLPNTGTVTVSSPGLGEEPQHHLRGDCARPPSGRSPGRHIAQDRRCAADAPPRPADADPGAVRRLNSRRCREAAERPCSMRSMWPPAGRPGTSCVGSRSCRSRTRSGS